eukprot:740046_1
MASDSMKHAQKLISLAVILLAVSLLNLEVVLGTTYSLKASSGQFECYGTSNDTCVFHCDAYVSNLKFYCYNVSDCQFEISWAACGLSSGTIFGGSALNLHVTSSMNGMSNFTINGGAGSNLHITCGLNGCSDATINVGDGSNLYVDVSGNGFFDATINGGAGSNIYINCPSNGCSGLHINAANAHYLQVNVKYLWSLGADGQDPVIYCPQNSDYNGQEIAPCIIDSVSMEDAEIHTKYGIPHDVWFSNSRMSISNSILYCEAGSTSDFFSKSSDCWITHSPTPDPSAYPSTSPTNPSAYPSVSPTNPSASPTNPSAYPSASPTHPSASPTNASAHPSTRPTNPSAHPSASPTNPSAYPSASPTHPSVYPSQSPSQPSVSTIHPSAYPSASDYPTNLANLICISLFLCHH